MRPSLLAVLAVAVVVVVVGEVVVVVPDLANQNTRCLDPRLSVPHPMEYLGPCATRLTQRMLCLQPIGASCALTSQRRLS